MRPRVVITSLWRNREWVVSDWVAAIREMVRHTAAAGYDPLLYAVDDSSRDGTVAALRAAGFEGDVAVMPDLMPSRPPTSNSSRLPWRKMRRALYGHLAYLRNHTLLYAIGCGAQWHVSIDSDILVAPTFATDLIGLGHDYVCGAIANTAEGRPNFGTLDRGRCRPLLSTVPGEVYRVQYGGACYAASLAALGSGAVYSGHKHGEDVAYCTALAAAGLELYAYTKPLAVHVLHPENLDRDRARFAAIREASRA